MNETLHRNEAPRVSMFGNLDLCGVMRGRSVPAVRTDEVIAQGLPWVPTNIMLSPFNTIPTGNPFGPMGETRIVGDPATRMTLPRAGERPALDLYLSELKNVDGQPWPLCPRNQLKAAIAKLRDEFGLVIKAGFEQECYIHGVQDVPTPAFSLAGTRAISGLADAVQAVLATAGTRLDQFVAEYGEHQFEIASPATEVLSSADQAVMAREAIRDAARLRGWSATFAPKPDPEQPGSGVHIHLSLWTADGKPVTAEQDALTDTSGAFVAGLLRDLTAVMGFTTPSGNSFDRLLPSSWVGVFNCFGERNREAAIRLCPRPLGPDGVNPAASIEFRIADGGCNPYLALAALIHAGMNGLRDALPAPESVDRDPATIDRAECEARGIAPIARSLDEVLGVLKTGPFLEVAFGPLFRTAYLAVLENTRADRDAIGGDYAKRYSRVV